MGAKKVALACAFAVPALFVAAAEVIYKGRPESEVDYTHRYIGYDAYPHGHGRFAGKKTPMQGQVRNDNSDDLVEGMAARLNLLAVGMDAQVLAEDVEVVRSLKGKPIPAGSSLGAEYVKALYARAAGQQRPMPAPTPEPSGSKRDAPIEKSQFPRICPICAES